MVKILSLTILLLGVLSTFAVEAAAAGAGTPVTCGSTITAPGNYFLTGDCTGPGITITASNVTLKLKGRTMDGLFDRDACGIFAQNVSKVKILGPGTIRNYGDGVHFGFVSDSEVQNVSCTNNIHGVDFFTVNGSEIDKVSATNNVGIVLVEGSDNEIEENKANGNSLFGINISFGSTGNEVGENTALGNGIFDLEDDNPTCDNNDWEDNTFNTASQSCID